MAVLVLIELDGAEPSDGSLRSLALARSLSGSGGGGDRPVAAVVFGALAEPDALAAYGVTDLYLVPPSALDGYAPAAWGRTLAGLIAEVEATAVMAA
jgi:electron transfer flavoprotein alpha subunit